MKDLLVHSNPVQCTVTVSVHCNNKDFQDLIYFYICYISKQRLLSSFRDSFVLISNQIRLFDALHPTVGHFQSFKLSSFTLGFIQTIPVSMFFPFFLFNPTVFSYFDKNTRFYNQGISIWVRSKPQLCNRRADSALPHTNMKSHLVNPAAYRADENSTLFLLTVKFRFVPAVTVIPRRHCQHCILSSDLPWCYHRAECWFESLSAVWDGRCWCARWHLAHWLARCLTLAVRQDCFHLHCT